MLGNFHSSSLTMMRGIVGSFGLLVLLVFVLGFVLVLVVTKFFACMCVFCGGAF